MLGGFFKKFTRANDAARGPALERDGSAGASKPSNGAKARLELGRAHARQRALTAALDCYRSCLSDPATRLDAQIEIANTLVDLWNIPQAVSAYAEALTLAPSSRALRSAVLFYTHYLPDVDADALAKMHREYGAFMKRTALAHRAPASASANKVLRVGYVSANLNRHSVGYFVEPLLEHCDRDAFQVYCYYCHSRADDTTARLRALADGWRDVAALDDDALTKLIVADEIDVLVDLAGHSKDNRLGVFAAKAAPVQMTWLGYPDTTGLDAVDYRIANAITDPVPEADARHSERLLRLEHTFLAYRPPADSPPAEIPGTPRAHVAFGCFNALPKINDSVLALWARILQAVPGSTLLVKAGGLDFPEAVERFEDALDERGIDLDRVELRGWVGDRANHLLQYHDVDIALDTWPYNGTTTTCEALWMGVPVLTVSGVHHMSRVGEMLLRCVGRADLVSGSADECVNRAIELAQDAANLRATRGVLRARLQSSPLLDHAGFARRMEQQYRVAWSKFYEGSSAGGA